MVFVKRENELFVTLSTKPRQPKWSFAGRHSQRDLRAGQPGPGSYNPRLSTAPAVSMSWRLPDRRGWRGSPGPGAYTLPSTMRPVSAFGSSAGFGSSQRGVLRKNEVPPPGSYDIGSLIGNEGPKVSLRGKPRDPYNARAGSTIGPGAYYNSEFLGRKRSYTFGIGHGDWKNASASDTVGPGSYNLPITFGQGPQISLKSRINQKSTAIDAPVLGPWTQFGY